MLVRVIRRRMAMEPMAKVTDGNTRYRKLLTKSAPFRVRMLSMTYTPVIVLGGVRLMAI